MATTLTGIIHGRNIELTKDTGLPDGQEVAVEIRLLEKKHQSQNPAGIPPVVTWKDRLMYNSAIDSLERIVKGTRLQAEALVTELETGRSNGELMKAHPELTAEDVQALRNYAKWPVGLRRSCGAWAEDVEELDKYLEWTRQHRKIKHREIPD